MSKMLRSKEDAPIAEAKAPVKKVREFILLIYEKYL
jgi:hypothetical protein